MKLSTSLLPLLLVGSCNAWTSITGTNTNTRHHHHHTSTTLLKSSTESSEAAPASAGFNVVLSPSTDPEAFDSSKIGAARVHRYIRDGDDDSEYVMWYVQCAMYNVPYNIQYTMQHLKLQGLYTF